MIGPVARLVTVTLPSKDPAQASSMLIDQFMPTLMQGNTAGVLHVFVSWLCTLTRTSEAHDKLKDIVMCCRTLLQMPG